MKKLFTDLEINFSEIDRSLKKIDNPGKTKKSINRDFNCKF